MKGRVAIQCYKLSQKWDLKNIANFFGLSFETGQEYILLRAPQLESIFQQVTMKKRVWIFKYGCLVMIHHDASEVLRLVKYFETAFENISLNLFLAFNDYHILEFEKTEKETDLTLYATVLAKSTELKYLENNIKQLLDQSEQFIFDLQMHHPKPAGRILKKTNLDLIKLQLNVINDLKIFDRPKEFDSEIQLRELYAATSQYYELTKRFEKVQQKVNDLIQIIAPYQSLGYYWRENRLLALEVFLIALFPASYLLRYFLSILFK